MSHNNPPVRGAVIAILLEHGPMTMLEITEAIGWKHSRVHSAISNARILHPGQFFRISSYRKHPERGKDIAVFAAGPGKDKPRPVLSQDQKKSRRRAVQNRYNRKNRTIIDTKARIKRAKSNGVAVSTNPWLRLMSPAVRSFVVQQEIRQNGPRTP